MKALIKKKKTKNIEHCYESRRENRDCEHEAVKERGNHRSEENSFWSSLNSVKQWVGDPVGGGHEVTSRNAENNQP